MKEETLLKALTLRQELDLLTSVEEAIRPCEYEDGGREVFRLTYITKALTLNGYKWQPVGMNKMKYIGNLLDRHDKEIRKEIADRIAELKKEIEEL